MIIYIVRSRFLREPTTVVGLNSKSGSTKNVRKSDGPREKSKKNSKRRLEFSGTAPRTQNKSNAFLMAKKTTTSMCQQDPTITCLRLSLTGFNQLVYLVNAEKASPRSLRLSMSKRFLTWAVKDKSHLMSQKSLKKWRYQMTRPKRLKVSPQAIENHR